MTITTTTILVAAALTFGGVEQKRPDWATDEVPDTIVTLVERAADTDDGDLRKSLLREAESQAREAVNADDQTSRRYALAVVLGLRANVEGGKTKVQAAAALSDELDVILEREPDHAGARHMLGRLHAGIRRMSRITRWLATNVMGGDALSRATWEAAEENLAYAEEHAPNVPDHHLQLALLYRDTDRPELAAEELSHVLAIEPRNVLERAVREEALRVRSELGQ
jgi:tetratricopeptide (TPR) repeat protein